MVHCAARQQATTLLEKNTRDDDVPSNERQDNCRRLSLRATPVGVKHPEGGSVDPLKKERAGREEATFERVNVCAAEETWITLTPIARK